MTVFPKQFMGEDWVSTIIWFMLIFVLMIFGPRLMVAQTVWKLERDVAELEYMAERSRNIVVKFASKKPSSAIRQSVKSFMEFFAISPVDIDPFGAVKRLDHIIRNADARFKYFVNQIAPGFSEEKKSNLKGALAGAMTTHQIAKIVRHFLETIKKYKIFQLALLLQMQLPIIMRIAKASVHATKAFVDGMPIGDSVGPLVAANMVPKKAKAKVYKEEQFSFYKTNILGRTVIVAKAHGPGAETGYPGKFLQRLLKEQKINRIITIDAAGKMEGERTGSIAEGVGVAIGGPGVDRYEIEQIATARELPLDAIAIKQSGEEEALVPMKKEILEAVPRAIEAVHAAIKRSRKGERILVMGIGNTCGVGDTAEAAEHAKEMLKKSYKKAEAEAQERKKPWWKF